MTIPKTESEVSACFCLTIKQPFTSAVVEEEKRWENQRYPLSRYVRDGTWVFLHSSASPWRAKYPSVDERWPNHPPFRSMKCGSILGMVRLDRAVHLTSMSEEEKADPWVTTDDKRVWKLEIGDVLAFESPFEYKRKPGVVDSMVRLRLDLPDLYSQLLARISANKGRT